MGKLPISRIFDTAIIAKYKSYSELEPFIEWVQSTMDLFFRTLNGQINIGENLNAQTFKVKLKSSSLTASAAIALRAQPIIVINGRQNPVTPAVSKFTWSINQNGQTQINVEFESAPTQGVEITILAFFS